MTKAMPFLQKVILLSYDPRPFPPGDFLVRKTACGRYACKSEHLGQGRQRTAFRSRFLYFRIAPWFSCQFFAKNTCWQTARKRQTPRTAQAAARLTSLISASPCFPADREDFCGQCAPDSRIWIAAATSAEMVYHRPLSLWQRRGHSAGSASVRRDFCIEKGQARKPVLF